MPRKARLNVPGAVYHVMGRCLNHLTLFTDDTDREQFLSLFALYLTRTNTRCYAWVLLMDTQYCFSITNTKRRRDGWDISIGRGSTT